MVETLVFLTIINALLLIATLLGQHLHDNRIRKIEGRFEVQDISFNAVMRSMEKQGPVPFHDKQSARKHSRNRKIWQGNA